jgi:hypothetical protein
MSPRNRIAAIVTSVAALGGLAAVALASQPETPGAATGPAAGAVTTTPEEVRTETVRRTVHVRPHPTTTTTTATTAPVRTTTTAGRTTPGALPSSAVVGDDQRGRGRGADDHADDGAFDDHRAERADDDAFDDHRAERGDDDGGRGRGRGRGGDEREDRSHDDD